MSTTETAANLAKTVTGEISFLAWLTAGMATVAPEQMADAGNELPSIAEGESELGELEGDVRRLGAFIFASTTSHNDAVTEFNSASDGWKSSFAATAIARELESQGEDLKIAGRIFWAEIHHLYPQEHLGLRKGYKVVIPVPEPRRASSIVVVESIGLGGRRLDDILDLFGGL